MLSRVEFDSRMNPSPIGRPRAQVSGDKRRVCFTPPSSQAPSTPVARSSCKQGGVWKNASPALKRWMASPACAGSASASSSEVRSLKGVKTLPSQFWPWLFVIVPFATCLCLLLRLFSRLLGCACCVRPGRRLLDSVEFSDDYIQTIGVGSASLMTP